MQIILESDVPVVYDQFFYQCNDIKTARPGAEKLCLTLSGYIISKYMKKKKITQR